MAEHGLRTDSEYKRQGEDGGRRKVTLNAYSRPKPVDPDIVVHTRGPKGPNLLVIEVKPETATDTKKEYDRVARVLCVLRVSILDTTPVSQQTTPTPGDFGRAAFDSPASGLAQAEGSPPATGAGHPRVDGEER